MSPKTEQWLKRLCKGGVVLITAGLMSVITGLYLPLRGTSMTASDAALWLGTALCTAGAGSWMAGAIIAALQPDRPEDEE